MTPPPGRKIVAVTIALAVVRPRSVRVSTRALGRDGTAGPSALLTPKKTDTVAGASLSIPNKSIAVLPFDNLSRDPDNAYFCEGVQDEI